MFRTAANKNGGKHITTVIVVSASGRKAPPFYIMAGKRFMSGWIDPSSNCYNPNDDELKTFTKEHWFPGDAVIKYTDNDSMEMDVLTAFVQHLDAFVRTLSPPEKSYLLSLDEHASRNGLEWASHFSKNNCEVVVSPADTSHFLQHCDQLVNKKFQSTSCLTRDFFSRSVLAETRRIRFNLGCATNAYDNITVNDIRSSFAKCGIFPFCPSLAKRFENAHTVGCREGLKKKDALEKAGVAARLVTVQMRHSDREVFEAVMRALHPSAKSSRQGPSRALQDVASILHRQETVNSILCTAVRQGSSSTNVS